MNNKKEKLNTNNVRWIQLPEHLNMEKGNKGVVVWGLFYFSLK